MKKKITVYSLLLLFLCPVIWISCDDLYDKTPIDEDQPSQETNTTELFILNEGLFNLNNSTLFRYSFTTDEKTPQFFRTVNKRGLGDTATDAAIYGGKIYLVVNVSSVVEVLDFTTGKSLKQIPLREENGSSRQPRYIDFHQNKAYVCSFDGTVAKIDTASLEVEAYASVGRNPDGICVQNNQLFVSNSGGLDADTQGVDNTISVIDISSFQEIKKIEVGPNPGKIMSDTRGYIYVVTRGKDLESSDYKLHKINSSTHQIVHTYNTPILNFTIQNNFAYAYSYNYQTQKSSFPLIDLVEDKVIVPNFIDPNILQTPYAITVNPYSDNIYLSDARDYQTDGDIYCFDQQGRQLYKLSDVGLNPNTILFSDTPIKLDTDDIPEPDHRIFASKVLEYCPAPGQFINTETSAYKEGYNENQVLALANEKIKKRSLFSLGAYGGYITLGFDKSIPNNIGDYDFKVYGNAFYSPTQIEGYPMIGSAEPGIVMVSKDVNKNGLPDDEWYELAGSEYHSTETIKNYEITYYKPQHEYENILWEDNQGNSGYIHKNSAHKQAYFPLWLETETLTFKGSKLPDNVKTIDGKLLNFALPWGYADNHPNHSDLSNFKIEWAVNEEGIPVELDSIDFIRIYTGVNQYAGIMGEISTEIQTIEVLHTK